MRADEGSLITQQTRGASPDDGHSSGFSDGRLSTTFTAPCAECSGGAWLQSFWSQRMGRVGQGWWWAGLAQTNQTGGIWQEGPARAEPDQKRAIDTWKGTGGGRAAVVPDYGRRARLAASILTVWHPSVVWA